MTEARPAIKPPTPVHDEMTHEKMQRVANVQPQLLIELQGVKAAVEASNKGTVGRIAWGVFIGLWAFLITFGILFLGLASMGLRPA